jgi:hypothetical protein
MIQDEYTSLAAYHRQPKNYDLWLYIYIMLVLLLQQKKRQLSMTARPGSVGALRVYRGSAVQQDLRFSEEGP